MRKIILVLSSISMLFTNSISMAQVNSNWKWSFPRPTGASYTWCKVWDASTWYAGGSVGTFMRTTDAGSTWYVRTGATGTSGTGVQVICRDAWFFDRERGILIGDAGSVTKTTDGGSSFTTIPGTTGFLWRHICFLDTSLGYIIAQDGYFAKTTNGGSNWTLGLIGTIGTDWAYDIHTSDGELILVSADEGHVFRSSDGGITWSDPISTGARATLERVRWISQDTALVVGQIFDAPYQPLVRLTTDGGLTWQDRSPDANVGRFKDIDVQRIDNNVKISVTGDPDYIYTTMDFGQSWKVIDFKAPAQMYNTRAYNATDFLGLSDSLLTVGNEGRVNLVLGSRRQMIGTWDLKAMNNVNMYDVWAESGSGKVIAVGEPTIPGQTADQILFSSDGGNDWMIVPTSNSTSSFTSICMPSESVGYIVGTSGTVMKTITGGLSWVPLLVPTSENLLRVEFVNENVGWVMGTNGTILKTTNGGANWSSQNSGIADPITESRFLHENLGYLCTLNDVQFQSSLVLRTTNGGTTWDTVVTLHSATAKVWATGFTMTDSLRGWVCGGDSRGEGVLQKTIDGGRTWVPVATPFQSTVGWRALDWKDSLKGVVAEFTRSIRTTNGGQTWEVEHLPGLIAADLTAQGAVFMVSADTGFASGTNCTVFKYARPNSSAGVVEWNPTISDGYELFQNYPNPFNPKTAIRFAIPARGVVSLKVYDILGRVVRTLVDNEPLNAGTMALGFDASGLASGVYLYILVVDDKPVAAKKMILLR